MPELTIEHPAPAPPAADENLALVALTPSELPQQQQQLAEWCDLKIASVQREIGTWRALEEEAITGGFRAATYAANARKAEKRIVYYQKIKAAIEAGYLIVPNMPVTLFAVRVDRERPPKKETDYRHGIRTEAQRLPAGEGRYVDDAPFIGSRKEPTKDYQGNPATKTIYFATKYDEDIDFPLRGVHPRVLEATGRAKALRLFDELGMVQNSGGRDPIVVGRLLDPRGNGRVATFFVAWWLNTADL